MKAQAIFAYLQLNKVSLATLAGTNLGGQAFTQRDVLMLRASGLL